MVHRVFVTALVVGLLLFGSGFAAPPAMSQSATPCGPFVAATINGEPADSFLPPEGHTGSSELVFAVEAGFVGDDCDVVVNSPPVLLGGWVDPSLTRVGSSFEYHVTYVDLDNDPPATITATLDGVTTRSMEPVDPLDTEYRDGAEFAAFFGNEFVDDILVPAAMEGDHAALLETSDGLAAASPIRVEGPRLRETVSGSLLLPNPSNRFLIHPIANGPTFNPQSEVLPPAGMILPAGDGVYSATFPIDPDAGAMGATWSVGSAAALRLRGFGLLEGAPGADFALGEHALVDPRAHAGSQSVDLAPDGALPDATGRYGYVELFPNSDTFRFALVGGTRFYVLQPDEATVSDAIRIGVWLELDADGDGATDVCVGTDVETTPGPHWVRVAFDRSTPMKVFDTGCTRDATPEDQQDGVTTLDDIQNVVAWGISPVKALRIEAFSAASQPTQADGPTLVDSAVLFPGFANTNGDVDACLYGLAAPLPASPLQPLVCVSDIGPNAGPVPAGATHANVWADQMVPALPIDALVPRRPYVEPLAYSFSYANNLNAGPGFELPVATMGRVSVIEDLDVDGIAEPDEPTLRQQDAIVLGSTSSLVFTLPFDRADGTSGYVVVYESGRGDEEVALPVSVQRFVNDVPAATLSVTMMKSRVAMFQLQASDPDEGQTETSRRLGGLRQWTLDFGDGTSVSGTFPMPSEVEHRYKPGDHDARLSVLDAAGEIAQADTRVVSDRRGR